MKIENWIVEKLKPLNPVRIILFGSYAYGNPGENSDLDILIRLKQNYTLFDLFDIKFALEDSLGISIDEL